MATILGSCRELLLELAIYCWWTVTRLVFALWWSWQKPHPLPPVTEKLLLRSATSLTADIRNGKVKSVDVVSAYIRRIREVQPILNAVVEERFEEALKDAEEVDRLVASGTMSPSQMSNEKPLLGLPFTSKNSIAVKGMRQDAGSLFWHGRRAVEDAPAVALLRAAGAIPLALTNVPEMCMWGDSHNLVDGATLNAHDTRRSPGGSSGGEGTLLAAAGSLIGIGTDIGGSVRIPAAYCGIFAHKPTAGVVPNTGLLPDVGEKFGRFNCVGPMTRFAEDLPLMLNVLAGSPTNAFRLNEKVNLSTLKLYYMDTEGSLFISRMTSDVRRVVGKVKSVDLVSAYIRRIREVQPIINAVVEERFEEAVKDAEEVDKLVASGTMSASQISKEKPLLGLPFTSKNSIAIKGMRHDAGSLFWLGRRAVEDAPSVASLRQAGAIPLALTNVPELCMWSESYNLVDGCTRNPHDTRRSPGGSSGGEGSLLAAAGSLIGLGTDFAGSVRIPSAYCGIFGHKPTAGVVPNTGLMPELGENVAQFNCVGPMTRYAEDLPLMLNVLTGTATERLRLNEQVNLKALKLYYMDTEGSLYISRVTTDMRLAVRRVTQYLTVEHGLEANQLNLPEMRFCMDEWFKVITIKDPTPLAEVFRPGGFNTLVELLRLLVGAGRHTLAALVASKRAPLHHFRSEQKAQAFIASIENARDRFEETLGDSGVLVLPASTSAAPFQNQEFLFVDSTGMTALFNLFKVPATVCPVMRSPDDLPLCVQVVAKRGNDRICIAVAREIERRFGGWIDPAAKLQRRA